MPVKFNGCPIHTGVLLVAVNVGNGLITTAAVLIESIHPLPSVTLNLYTPAIAAVAAADTCGLFEAEVYVLGPLHAYIVPLVVPVRFNGCPSQTGVLLDALTVGN